MLGSGLSALGIAWVEALHWMGWEVASPAPPAPLCLCREDVLMDRGLHLQYSLQLFGVLIL